ncbi:hypothetical protein FOZ60_012178 [Perkinsus olseni]|uniref:Uncharacterized protein n=1 Tax=Perkinsus olseni TaxID=32597 RepID=A0A7J6PAM6_PEROL|nr:hypothetical protein FOZ60_012178 [Perkinsus olseni]
MSRLHIACIAGAKEVDEELLADGVDVSAVMTATMWGRRDLLRRLLEANPEALSEDCSLLHIAAHHCQLETLKWLVEEGGFREQLASLDSKGRTPLKVVEERGEGRFLREETIAYLREVETTETKKTKNAKKKK